MVTDLYPSLTTGLPDFPCTPLRFNICMTSTLKR